MDCFGCKWHEAFSDEIDGEWFNDGCVCNNEQAEKELFEIMQGEN